jgi:tetratricopeptide (TPR) repeat protein
VTGPPRPLVPPLALWLAGAILLVGTILYIGSLGLRSDYQSAADKTAPMAPQPTTEPPPASTPRDLFLRRAQEASTKGDWAEAARIYTYFLERFPHDPQWEQIHLGRAEALRKSGQIDAALAALEHFIGLPAGDPAKASALVELAELQVERGERELAKLNLTRAGGLADVQLAPQVFNRLGQLYELDQENDSAIQAYETICMQYPASQPSGEAHLRLAELLERTGDPDAAVRTLEHVLELPSDNPHRLAAEARLRQLGGLPD